MATLLLVSKKIENEDKKVCTMTYLTLFYTSVKYDNFYLQSKAEIITNENDIDDVFQWIYTTIISDTKIFRKKFRLDYWFSHRSYY